LKCPLCGKPLRHRKQKDGSLLIYCEGKDCKYRIEVEVEPHKKEEEEKEIELYCRLCGKSISEEEYEHFQGYHRDCFYIEEIQDSDM
jgi:ssDNA-binding Zn-finger/Zn-ribbon topoisomerase 1